MRDYIKLVKEKIISYETLTKKLQKTASGSKLNKNIKVKNALDELKKSLDTAKTSACIIEGDDTPLWWICLHTGEVTNEYIEKLATDYMNALNIIKEMIELQYTARGKFSEPGIFPKFSYLE